MFSHNHSHGEGTQDYAQRIRDMEGTIEDLTIRMKSLEAALDSEDVQPDKRDDLELELADIKKVLEASREQLTALQKKNRQSFMVAAILFFICFLLYGLYVMVVGV